MWRLHYSPEAVRYIADNWGLIDDVLAAIKLLRFHEDSPPPEHVRDESGIYVWTIAQHQVFYAIIRERRLTHILVIKPIE